MIITFDILNVNVLKSDLPSLRYIQCSSSSTTITSCIFRLAED